MRAAVEVEEPSNAAAVHPDADTAIKLIKVPEGLKISVWATEPLLANAVALNFDEKGRAYVAETFRNREGTHDNRDRMKWLSSAFRKTASPERMAGVSEEMMDRELASRSVEDREKFSLEFSERGPMTKNSERIQLVEDTDGDGRADRSKTFAAGFNSILDGLAAGVLPYKGEVFVGNIPHLWSLKDTNGDGVADVRKSLSYGYGIRFAYTGHDLHGLRIGPDGRLYYSVGDRGANVKTKNGRIELFETGAVFRCNLDGSNLETYATGLRNPQDLVFDDHGNLFTGDNNSDGGDKSRLVQVVQGGDSGWRIGFQYMDDASRRRGPWNAEKMWHPPWQGQAAFLVPPIANITDGPSGIAFYPGTGWSKDWERRFFLVDFRGQNTVSGVQSFSLKPKGAGFEIVNPQKSIWGVLATDAQFGPDGSLYVADWLQGWKNPGKGRIYRVYDPVGIKAPETLATKRLIAEGMNGRSNAELAKLLAHPDIRVRQEAQFQLAKNHATGVLIEAAQHDKNGLARLHGIWGLWQLLLEGGVASKGADDALVALTKDPDPEVRAQATHVLGDAIVKRAHEALVERLADQEPRVRFFAATALGRLGRPEAVARVLDMLRANGDQDPYLRHAGVMALLGSANATALGAAAVDASHSVRMVALLTMRRRGQPEIAAFLRDTNQEIVREAARAISDEPIATALDALAALPLGKTADTPTAIRIINANYRLGTADAAKRLATFANQANLAPAVRADAVTALSEWPAKSRRDRVTGLWRPIPAQGRATGEAMAALRPMIGKLLKKAPGDVRMAAVRAIKDLAMAEASPQLLALLVDKKAEAGLRVEALKSLAEFKVDKDLARAIKIAYADKDPALRVEALRVDFATNPGAGSKRLAEVVAKGTIPERQTALKFLAKVEASERTELVSGWMDQVLAGKLPPEITLDILDAAAKVGTPDIKKKLATFEKRRTQDDLGPYREALVGGNPKAGYSVFSRGDTACIRCHVANDEGGGDAGPSLRDVGKKRTREYLLEAVAYPSTQFAEGFESVILTMKDGSIHGGTVKRETATELEVLSPEVGLEIVKRADIKVRERGASGMPDGFGQILTRRELRDLVAYLASLH